MTSRAVLLVAAVLAFGSPALRAADLQSFVRVKGQEAVRLKGIGLVVGLDGTGDTRFTPMHAAVASMLGKLGNPVSDLRELNALRNVALVTVSCEVSPTGGREGDRVDCVVTSIGTARSIANGRLMQTPMRGPLVNDPTTYALAEGDLSLESLESLNNARIEDGAALVLDMPAPFVLCGDTITLVIDNAHASFVTASAIASAINQRLQTQVSRDPTQPVQVARAIDAKNVEVFVPEFLRRDMVAFVADVMSTPLATTPNTQARVILDEKSGTIVVTDEVELTPVLVTHRNLIVFPPDQPAPGPIPNNFAAIVAAGPGLVPPRPLPPKLNDLIIALDKMQVSAEDKIAIIKRIAESGKLQARVIYE
ncbi:Flagellar P-ring protein precursor [Planctomycetes bacterium Pan216]|uniref:Flagellar P-ring protein n=1 Tax=Kolteria novifilia TaxID=2527975 RepID=A0A518AXX3_9BACT|nr:Flagellar P-ring protein precursor [Planctomycetes bacterium Pan216]